MISSVQHVAHPVGVFHQLREVRELRIISARVEVRRAVRIRIFRHGKGVGNQMIYPSHKKVVQQMLHIANAESPAVGAEEFAHCASLFLRVQVSPGSAHFAQRIVEEFAVPFCHQFSLLDRSAKIVLAADHINTGHILPFHCAEPVRRAKSQAAVDAVVLDDMSDILHSVLPAPLSDRAGEVLRVQLGNAVHVVVADLRLQFLLRALHKEERKERAIFCPVSVSQHLLELIAPGKRHFLLAQLRVKALLTDISKLRLIGEKSGDRFTEFIGIFGVVRLVDAFNLRVSGHLIDHVDIGRISAVSSCAIDHMNAPLSFGKLKGNFSVLTQICQIHDVLVEYVSLLIAERHCGDKRISRLFCVIDRISDLPETDRRLEHPRNVQRKRAARAVNVDCRACNILLFALRMLLDQAVGVAGGEMLVVEDPYLHVSLF